MGERRGRLESGWTRVGRMHLHARVSVDPVPRQAPTVVLVHGLIVSSRYMVPVAEHLAPYCRVYAPDLPGFGRSVKPRHVLDTREHADVLAAWMDAVGLERASLLGNSFGSQVAVDFAIRHPRRTRRLILTGPTMDPKASPPMQFLR